VKDCHVGIAVDTDAEAITKMADSWNRILQIYEIRDGYDPV
jgi:hypothetical protein